MIKKLLLVSTLFNFLASSKILYCMPKHTRQPIAWECPLCLNSCDTTICNGCKAWLCQGTGCFCINEPSSTECLACCSPPENFALYWHSQRTYLHDTSLSGIRRGRPLAIIPEEDS